MFFQRLPEGDRLAKINQGKINEVLWRKLTLRRNRWHGTGCRGRCSSGSQRGWCGQASHHFNVIRWEQPRLIHVKHVWVDSIKTASSFSDYLSLKFALPPGRIFAIDYVDDIALKETEFILVLGRVGEQSYHLICSKRLTCYLPSANYG